MKKQGKAKPADSYESGYDLRYALNHPRKKPHVLPKGWRWLRKGEKQRIGDVCCDPRIAPVRIIVGGIVMTQEHHPVRRKREQGRS